MTERYDQNPTDTSEKAPEHAPQMMRVMSETEIREYLAHPLPGNNQYTDHEVQAVVDMARLWPAFFMTFAGGKREWFDFRRPA